MMKHSPRALEPPVVRLLLDTLSCCSLEPLVLSLLSLSYPDQGPRCGPREGEGQAHALCGTWGYGVQWLVGIMAALPVLGWRPEVQRVGGPLEALSVGASFLPIPFSTQHPLSPKCKVLGSYLSGRGWGCRQLVSYP